MNRNSMLTSQSISGPPSSSRSASAAPASLFSQLARESNMSTDGQWVSLQSPSATREQLHSLLALPASLVKSTSSSRHKGSSRKPRLAREGAIHSTTFDSFGRRPYPTNGLSLEQAITLELSLTTNNPFINSPTVAGTSSYISRTFAMSDFAGAANLLTVFDQYRFEQIECWLDCPSPNQVISYPELSSCVDLDDANTPTAIGQVNDHLGSVISAGPVGHYHKWKPHIAIASYSGAFTSYSNVPAGWIDSASPNVQHFGVKVATLATGTTAVGYNLTVRAVVSVRAPTIN